MDDREPLAVVSLFVHQSHPQTRDQERVGFAPRPRFGLSDAKAVIVSSAQSWSKDNASRLAAAFSFYAILSLAPLLVMAVAIGSNFLDVGTVRHQLLRAAGEGMGPGARDFLATMIDNANKPGAGTVATILSILLALYGASNLFGQLAESVNAIWGIQIKGNPFKNFVVGKLVSIVMVLMFASLVVAWLIVDSVVTWIARNSGAFLGWPVVSFLVGVVFLGLVFAAAFKALPKDMVKWSDVWIGALVTAVLFSLLKSLLSLYFSMSHISSAYGPAGALVAVLLWFYYAAQIFFFGVEMTCTYAHQYGSHRGEATGDLEYS